MVAGVPKMKFTVSPKPPIGSTAEANSSFSKLPIATKSLNQPQRSPNAKLPWLRCNQKIKSFEELTVANAVGWRSALPGTDVEIAMQENIRCVAALQMPDATCIPQRGELSDALGPTITVELKPKQGFFQMHEGVDVPFCNNCVMQIQKVNSAGTFYIVGLLFAGVFNSVVYITQHAELRKAASGLCKGKLAIETSPTISRVTVFSTA
uniref:Inositol-pentakisphosphate 2-kinase n=1 Tax=Panagrellus redivivus TaxID=6233 RepID=A0A7E4V5C9_PANRE